MLEALNSYKNGNYSTYASGGPAGGQTSEKFDKQVLRPISMHAKVLVFQLYSTYRESIPYYQILLDKFDK